jgi:drug/metabolite transporter (DMT)-like permease
LPLGLLRAARLVVLAQALALLVVIGLTVPDFLNYLLHPISCRPDSMCLDLRDIPFAASVAFLGPPIVVLLASYWLWRRPRKWPAVLPLLIDAAAIAVVAADLIGFARTGSAEPNILVQVLLVLLPAVVSLTVVLNLLVRSRART